MILTVSFDSFVIAVQVTLAKGLGSQDSVRLAIRTVSLQTFSLKRSSDKQPRVLRNKHT